METERRFQEPPLTSPEFWTQCANHFCAFFPTTLPIIKNFRAAANALQDKDLAKAERILGVKLQP